MREKLTDSGEANTNQQHLFYLSLFGFHEGRCQGFVEQYSKQADKVLLVFLLLYPLGRSV